MTNPTLEKVVKPAKEIKQQAVKKEVAAVQPEQDPSAEGQGARAFTYIGAGDSSPYVINLMGKQKFVRGQLTEVTDPALLAKLPGMSTFIEGPADAELLHKIDQEGKDRYEAQRQVDQLANSKYVKKHHGE